MRTPHMAGSSGQAQNPKKILSPEGRITLDGAKLQADPQGADEDVGEVGGESSRLEQELAHHASGVPPQQLHQLGQKEGHLCTSRSRYAHNTAVQACS